VDTSQALVNVGHYNLIASVCIDYCVAISRTDLLFGPIFDRFQREGRLSVFLELLEPYILNDKLHFLKPVVMQAFVEHYKATGQIASVERCVLHMDTTCVPPPPRASVQPIVSLVPVELIVSLVSGEPLFATPCPRSMDIDSAVRLTLSHRLFSAFIHVVNHGLHDFTTPIDVLLAHAVDLGPGLVRTLMRARGVADASPTTIQPTFSGTSEDRRSVGLKLLLYIQVGGVVVDVCACVEAS
jgi:hypothetical protein